MGLEGDKRPAIIRRGTLYLRDCFEIGTGRILKKNNIRGLVCWLT